MKHSRAGRAYAANFLIHQQVGRYKTALSHWVNSVRRAPTLLDALRAANQRPTPGALIRALRSLYSADQNRADQSVQRSLAEHLKDVDVNTPSLQNLMRLSQCRWPDIYRKLSAMRC
jgi:hypothetical protein